MERFGLSCLDRNGIGREAKDKGNDHSDDHPCSGSEVRGARRHQPGASALGEQEILEVTARWKDSSGRNGNKRSGPTGMMDTKRCDEDKSYEKYF